MFLDAIKEDLIDIKNTKRKKDKNERLLVIIEDITWFMEKGLNDD